jgi:hypothetical protein
MPIEHPQIDLCSQAEHHRKLEPNPGPTQRGHAGEGSHFLPPLIPRAARFPARCARAARGNASSGTGTRRLFREAALSRDIAQLRNDRGRWPEVNCLPDRELVGHR